jgi:uncharacterized membrane protein
VKTALDKRIRNLLLIYVCTLLVWTIIFYKTSVLTNIRIITGIFYLYIIPGYIILELFTKLSFEKKVALGFIIGYTINTIISYYLNFFFMIPLIYTLLLPPMIIGTGYLIKKTFKKDTDTKKQKQHNKKRKLRR